jgi:hypothetical protein
MDLQRRSRAAETRRLNLRNVEEKEDTLLWKALSVCASPSARLPREGEESVYCYFRLAPVLLLPMISAAGEWEDL